MIFGPKWAGVLALAALTGCASLPSTPVPQPQTPRAGLEPQTLSEGACGIFLWTKDTPRTFVYYQQQNRPTARILLDGQANTVPTDNVTAGLGDPAAFELMYQHEGADITVRGQYSEDMDGGRRIDTAAISIRRPDGWQEILPVSGVFACR